MAIPDETRIQAALEQLDKDDLQALILRMVQQHPDLAGLIVSDEKKAVKKPRKAFNAEVYRLQVEKILLKTSKYCCWDWRETTSMTRPSCVSLAKWRVTITSSIGC